MQNTRAVHSKRQHINVPGDGMEKKYAATYKFGNTTVNIVEPPPISEEEKQKIIHDFHLAGWAAWNSLTREEQLALNAEAE
jgi:hypothetical protein